ncbi:MAG: efflux RND transporter permease subunit, partial [Stenotrophobium sp.]
MRGYSSFGDSFVYVIFDDRTDLYWARSRVLEYLSQMQGRLPATAKPELGPDATGTGWVYQYALTDPTGKLDISQLTALQDWFLKYELKTVPNVAEVATVGGMVPQYQVVLDPEKMRSLRITQQAVVQAIRDANSETGGSVLEQGEAEYMVTTNGYLKTLDDFRLIPMGLGPDGTPILLRDIAWIQRGPETRRGVAELDGQGEVVGGIIVMRTGKNALDTITAVKAKLAELQKGLPAGVQIVPVYDRSGLIDRAVHTLRDKLIEEFIVVALVCLLFLFHLRSALVAVVTLPLGILSAFIVMHWQGINANIMSLGGIAIAIGAMLDAAIVMIENAHKHLEAWRHRHPGREPHAMERLELMAGAAAEVGPALFFSLLIITLSFVPVFTLQAQEGKLFAPLAFTKTYAMAAAAGLSVTLVPVLMTFFIRGRIRDERENPLSRILISVYQPLIHRVLAYPRATIAIALALLALTVIPVKLLGTEFMPPLDEGDLLYMPSALPGLSVGKAQQLLQQTDRIIKTFPEVEHVFGKAGRAQTATDPAPMEMFETMVQLKPQSQWPAGETQDQLIEKMNAALQVPGLSNLWVQPIRNRVEMSNTGIKSPIGIKIAGPDLKVIESIGEQVEQAVKQVPGAASVFLERVQGGRYVQIDIDRLAAARYGLSVESVQQTVDFAIGGENVTQTVEGLQRFPVNLRYPRELRDSVAALNALPIVTPGGQTITLGTVTKIRITDGPPMIKSENARLNGWVYVDIRGSDLGAFVAAAQRAVNRQVKLPPGYSIDWS